MLAALDYQKLSRTSVNWRLSILVAYYAGWEAVTAKDGTLAQLLFKSFGCSEITIPKVTKARKQLVKSGLLGFDNYDANFFWILPSNQRSIEQSKGFFLWTQSECGAWLKRNATNLNRILPEKEIEGPPKDIQRITSVDETEVIEAIEMVSAAIRRNGTTRFSPIATFVASVAGCNWLEISINKLWDLTGRLVDQSKVRQTLYLLKCKGLIEYCDADPHHKTQIVFVRILPDVTPSEMVLVVRPHDELNESFPLFDSNETYSNGSTTAIRGTQVSTLPTVQPVVSAESAGVTTDKRNALAIIADKDELILLIDERVEFLLSQKRVVVSFGNQPNAPALPDLSPASVERTYSTDEIKKLFGKSADWIARQKKDVQLPFPKATNGKKRPQVYRADDVDRLMNALATRKKQS